MMVSSRWARFRVPILIVEETTTNGSVSDVSGAIASLKVAFSINSILDLRRCDRFASIARISHTMLPARDSYRLPLKYRQPWRTFAKSLQLVQFSRSTRNCRYLKRRRFGKPLNNECMGARMCPHRKIKSSPEDSLTQSRGNAINYHR
jgi:hypothetical protein